MESGVKNEFQEVVNSDEKGYSLIELIMVIVIAGIIAGIAIPKINNISEVDIYATARQVKSDIRFTQQLAMSKFMQTTITFAANSDTYVISNASASIDKRLPPSSRATFNAAGSGSTDLIYTFNSSGDPVVPSTGGPWNIGISSGGNTVQVVVADVTGRATIP